MIVPMLPTRTVGESTKFLCWNVYPPYVTDLTTDVYTFQLRLFKHRLLRICGGFGPPGMGARTFPKGCSF